MCIVTERDLFKRNWLTKIMEAHKPEICRVGWQAGDSQKS
jgi:hypothetical protein